MLSQQVAHAALDTRHAANKLVARRLIRLQVAATEQVITSSIASQSAAAPVTSLQQLPGDLQKAVALLEAPNSAAPGGTTRVFLLGVSHVSKVSCKQAKDLIRAVKPEVVMVELCKDRLGLLIDSDNPDRRQETWHCRKVSIQGVPADDPLWPTAAQLHGLLISRIGAAISTRDIEADVNRLLATGLFGKGRPLAENAKAGEAPQFGAVKPDADKETAVGSQQDAARNDGLYSGEVGLQLVPPLGSLKFIVEPRKLPLITTMDSRLDSSLRDAGVTQQQLQAVVNSLLEEVAKGRQAAKEAAASSNGRNVDSAEQKEGSQEDNDKDSESDALADADNSLPIYLTARAQLAALFSDPSQIVVAFSCVETGRVEVLVRARRAADPEYVSGLECSAINGEGQGIDSFKPQRASVQLSPGMFLPAEAAERLAAARAARQAERVLAPSQGWQRRTAYRLWDFDEVSSAESELPSSPVADLFGRLMTGLYSKLQAAAGEAAGISSGAVWRAAMEAACEVGSQQLLLGDRPADVSQRRLANAITTACGSRLTAAFGLLVTGIVTTATHALPDIEAAAAAATGSAATGDAGIVLGAAAAALALAWPVLGPFAEVLQFSRLSGEEVEKIVEIKDPLQVNTCTSPVAWWCIVYIISCAGMTKLCVCLAKVLRNPAGCQLIK
eukprot:GHRR01015999.1.p1 GENE.GHRR01015999.1~~GHRR01015999.1.p1  ORF type:complete len:671 (+),score=251.32 GHRR01015999.1:265-2277(+)